MKKKRSNVRGRERRGRLPKDSLVFEWRKLQIYNWLKFFKGNFTQTRFNAEVGKNEKFVGPLQIEPIGFTIILFLAFILMVQTIGMFMHRYVVIIAFVRMDEIQLNFVSWTSHLFSISLHFIFSIQVSYTVACAC